jgi:hypothetical protein
VSVIVGDCVSVMRDMAAESVDAIVTDPPYGLGFMGKEWDDLPPGREWADECLRVLKPGGHLLAFGGTRTYHRLACAIEDAGFEIRDCLAWLYGQGFPKSRNMGDGWGTALKPAHEPIVMARKPLVGTVTVAGPYSGYGNTVKIYHGWGITTLYAHNSQLMVKPGDWVRKGQLIARSGASGFVEGAHVHYEVLKGGVAINPLPYLDLNILSASTTWTE